MFKVGDVKEVGEKYTEGKVEKRVIREIMIMIIR